MMGKKDDQQDDDLDWCPPEPAGCGGRGWVMVRDTEGKMRKDTCYTCSGNQKIPKKP